MAEARKKEVNRKDPQICCLSVIIHDVSMETTEKDIEKIMKRKFDTPVPDMKLGKPYEINGERRRKIYLNFNKQERVNELMRSPSIRLNEQELRISRYIPKNLPLTGHITSMLLIMICKTERGNGLEKKVTEYDLKKYFEKFGKIDYCEWESDEEVILEFHDYDSVDQIILHGISHTINGIKVNVEKTLPKERTIINTSDQRPYCIHVTNMPFDITSEELSLIFQVHVAYILLRPGDLVNEYSAPNDPLESEGWIKNMSNQQTARNLAMKYSGVEIRGFKICCDVIHEPLNTTELCRDFEKGKCRFSSKQCYYKHIMCNKPDICDNAECWYGHSTKRRTTSKRQPIQDSEKNPYRLRISNLPPTSTKQKLQKRLNLNASKDLPRLILPEKQNPNSPMVVYLINQPSENFLRNKIREWNDRPFSESTPNKMKCQLEMNMDFFDWNDKSGSLETFVRSRTSSSTSNTTSTTRLITMKPAPWYKGDTDNKMNTKTDAHSVHNHIRKPADMNKFAPQWCWTDNILSNGRSFVYSLMHTTNKEIKAAIKIYTNKHTDRLSRLHAQCERIALEKLTGLNGVPQFIASNLNATNGIESNNDPWIITEYIEGDTLSDFIGKSSVELEDALIITFKLLNIVKQMHSRNIVHRNIRPENIIIRKQLDVENNQNLQCCDKISLVLTGFSFACIHQENDENNVHNNTAIFKDNHNQIWNNFYQVPQFETQSSTNGINKNQQRTFQCSSNIDTTLICAILFWLITKCYPRESRNIHEQAPHELIDHANLIDKELDRATGIWTGMERRAPLAQHLKLIFDRGFAGPDQHWPIEELEYQLQFMIQLLAKKKENDGYFPLAINQIEPWSCTTKSDSFLQLVSLIDGIKKQFQICYPSILWSTYEKSQWSGNSRQIENHDFLTFKKQKVIIPIEIIWHAQMDDKQDLTMTIIAKINNKINVKLPLGIWNQYEEEKNKEEIFKAFELKLKILIDILYAKETK